MQEIWLAANLAVFNVALFCARGGVHGGFIPLSAARALKLGGHGQSGLAAHFGDPPADSNAQKTPVVEELRRFALKGVSDKLQNPSHYE